MCKADLLIQLVINAKTVEITKRTQTGRLLKFTNPTRV